MMVYMLFREVTDWYTTYVPVHCSVHIPRQRQLSSCVAMAMLLSIELVIECAGDATGVCNVMLVMSLWFLFTIPHMQCTGSRKEFTAIALASSHGMMELRRN